MKNLLLFLALVPIMSNAQKVELLPKASISYCYEKMRITDEDEESITLFLTKYWKYMTELWNPIA